MCMKYGYGYISTLTSTGEQSCQNDNWNTTTVAGCGLFRQAR